MVDSVTLDKILGTEFPIIQGGMANIATGAFAAAVSNAGAMGIIATGGLHLDQIVAEIREAKRLTDKPFGVNIMMMHREVEAIAQIVIDEGVSFVATGAGNPSPYIQAWKEAGIKVFPVIPTVALARRMEKAGVDGIIAEGTESGGHVGELTTMALVPQVVDAVNIPVVAAGGIGCGRQFLAATALGAVGVQVGTVLLASEECPVSPEYKAAILKASDTATVVIGRSAGVPVRVIKNPMVREYLKEEAAGASKEELEHFTLGALRRAVSEGDVKHGSLMAGQIAGQVTEVKCMRAIFEELCSGYNQRLSQLTPLTCAPEAVSS